MMITFNYTTGIGIERSELVKLYVNVTPAQRADRDCWGVPLSEDFPTTFEWRVISPHSIMLAGKLKHVKVRYTIDYYLNLAYHEKFRLDEIDI